MKKYKVKGDSAIKHLLDDPYFYGGLTPEEKELTKELFTDFYNSLISPSQFDIYGSAQPIELRFVSDTPMTPEQYVNVKRAVSLMGLFPNQLTPRQVALLQMVEQVAGVFKQDTTADEFITDPNVFYEGVAEV